MHPRFRVYLIVIVLCTLISEVDVYDRRDAPTLAQRDRRIGFAGVFPRTSG